MFKPRLRNKINPNGSSYQTVTPRPFPHGHNLFHLATPSTSDLKQLQYELTQKGKLGGTQWEG